MFDPPESGSCIMVVVFELSHFAHLCEVCELSLCGEVCLAVLILSKEGVSQMQNTCNNL